MTISSKCCDALKKRPVHQYERKTGNAAIVGTMAQDSTSRTTAYRRNGCNSFGGNRPMSTPMAFWMEQDVWDYLEQNDVPYSSIYNMGYSRTGCMFCMFGAQHEEPTRFQRMKETHPQQYRHCIERLGCGHVLDVLKIKY